MSEGPAPDDRAAMWHVHESLPTLQVSRGEGPVQELPERARRPDLAELTIRRADGTPGTVREVLADTSTDAFVALQGGELAEEWYAPGGRPDGVHAVFSVTKSLVGCVTGVLADQGALDVERPVETYVPELGSSGYAGATLLQLLDMRSGVRFREDYTDPAAEIRIMDEWVAGDRGLYAYLVTLGREQPHGGSFRYRSSDTDVLGWVCERASGRSMPTLLADLLWAPLGAEHDGKITCDRLGTAVHDGGFGATARDLARFGQLLLSGGTVPVAGGGSRTVIPPRWLREAWAVDAEGRTAFADSPAELSFPGGWYRRQFWFRVGPYGDVLVCLGIYGQMIYVSRRTGTVCVKLSKWPDAQNPAFLHDTLRVCDVISGALSGKESSDEPHRLGGVVSGLSRHGGRRPGPTVV